MVVEFEPDVELTTAPFWFRVRQTPSPAARLALAAVVYHSLRPLAASRCSSQVGRNNSATKQAVAGWAKRHALAAAKQRQLGGSGARSAAYLVARAVILEKVKAALGLDKCFICLTGAAPMPKEVMEYFGKFVELCMYGYIYI